MPVKRSVLNLFNMLKTKATEIVRKNHEIDAKGQSVGRVATRAAMILRGKNKPTFQPHIDAGDFVTIINVGAVKFTGKKFVQKDYRHHTMYPGGIKRVPMKKLFEEKPAEIMRKAVYGMLPNNNRRKTLMRRLTLKV